MSTFLVAAIFIGFLVVATVSILVWDAFLYTDDIPGNSITQIIIRSSKRYPFIPFLWGFITGLLTGHWFA